MIHTATYFILTTFQLLRNFQLYNVFSNLSLNANSTNSISIIRYGVTKGFTLANNNGNRHVCLHFQMELQSIHDCVRRLPGMALGGRVFRIQTWEIEIPRLDTLRLLIAASPSS